MRLFPILLAAFVFAVPVRAQSLAITGVTVVDPSVAASRQPGMVNETVVIRNGHIVAVGPSATVPIPRGARVVDGRGKYLMPGLWDSHVHFMNTGPSALPLYVALGVTSVREMGGYLDSTRAWQSRMRAATLVGPRILTPGPILEAPSYLAGVRQRSIRDPRIGQRVLPYRVAVGNAADARRAIDSLVKLHVDFVKIRTTESPEAYFAILAEARRAGLKVAGHRPSVVPLPIAVDSGQRDIEHALALLHLSADARDSIYLEFAKWGTWYTPTLVVTRAVGLPADSVKRAIFSEAAVRGDERQVFASRWLLEWWRMQVDERLADTTAVDPNNGRVLYESSVADVRRMHELGVLMLAGTDAGSVLIYPGFALHEELRLLVEDAGFTPLEALWSAIVGPARFAGLQDSLGSISAGKIADLVLLDANPLDNIRNTRRIAAVMQGSRFFARKDLDALLARARRLAAPAAPHR